MMIEYLARVVERVPLEVSVKVQFLRGNIQNTVNARVLQSSGP